MSNKKRSISDFFANVLGGGHFAGGSGHAEERGEAGRGDGPKVKVFAMGPDGAELPPELAELQRELEGLFGGLNSEDCGDPDCLFHDGKKQKDSEPKVDWRRTLYEIQTGKKEELHLNEPLYRTLGRLEMRALKLQTQLKQGDLEDAIALKFGEMHFAGTQMSATLEAVAKLAEKYGKALEAAAAEHEELLRRISAANGSAAGSERSWFSYGDVSRAWRLVKNGLKEGETYFPQEGVSSVERQLATSQHTVNRLAEVQAMLAGLGDQEKLTTFLSSIFGDRNVTEVVNEFIVAPATTPEPIGEVLEAPAPEINA